LKRLLTVAIAALVLMAGSDYAWARRRLFKDINSELRAADRFVDFGITLKVVRADESGEELIRGAPKLIILREHSFGGIVDTRARPPQFCAPSRSPAVWYCSEDQEPLVIHGDDLPDRLLVYGSEGGGKTQALAMWAVLRVLEFTGQNREIGLTAPTNPRTEMIYQAIADRVPATWFRWVDRDRIFHFVNGVRARLVSTHRQSRAEGSRIQGYNWSASGNDEVQDSLDADADIEMRLRSAPKGRGKRFATATAKDNTEWRTWRDSRIASGLWHLAKLIGPRSPFVHASVWADRKSTLTEREYNRRVWAMDVGPEHQLYHTWSRDNVRPLPTVPDSTAVELAQWGGGITILSGHDPGTRNRSTIFLKAYQPRIGRRQWWVVDEIVTELGTVEQNASAVLERLQTKWGANLLTALGRRSDGSNRVLIHADPYTDTGNDARHPDRSVYTQFRTLGMQIVPAAMQSVGGESKPKQIPKQARIDMVCMLLCNSEGTRRLFVAQEDGKPVAPKLVKALETLERDAAGDAEMDRKGEGDLTGPACALGYALWKLEKPSTVRDAPPQERRS
jgi:hypothetical protein